RSASRRRAREMRSAVREETWSPDINFDVLAAVDRLSVRQRAVVVLTYWEDLGPSQVSARLGISEGSVKRHLNRARSRLREYLDESQRRQPNARTGLPPDAYGPACATIPGGTRDRAQTHLAHSPSPRRHLGRGCRRCRP